MSSVHASPSSQLGELYWHPRMGSQLSRVAGSPSSHRVALTSVKVQPNSQSQESTVQRLKSSHGGMGLFSQPPAVQTSSVHAFMSSHEPPSLQADASVP